MNARSSWRIAAAVAVIAIGMALPAQAQTPPKKGKAPAAAAKRGPKVFVSGDGGYQTSSSGFTSQVTFPLYAEDATFTATAPNAGGAVVAMRAGFRLWRNLAVGAGVTGFWSTRSADVTASLPHPFYFNQPRSADGSASGLTRNEAMVAVEASWIVPLRARMDMQVFAGPAFFNVRADLPTSVQFTEAYPYTTATFTSLQTTSVSDSATGFTVGADVAYMFNPSIGVGGHLRFSRASATLSSAGGQQTSIDLGGFQAGGGLRFRF